VANATLMVHLELGRSNANLLLAAGDLAESMHASVIGIAACQTMPLGYGDKYFSGDSIQQLQEEVDKEFKEAETEFLKALQPRVSTLEWRSMVTFVPPADYLAREARCADVVITGVTKRDFLDSSRHTDTIDLVMQLGRPVLIVPETTGKLNLNRVIVAWKDTRESRRAALDALPVLKLATHVVVAEIATEENVAETRKGLADVLRWLDRHGVVAEALVTASAGNNTKLLGLIADQQDADIIVAGAYGHSRLREWVLGGVTSDLLLCADRCTLVSH
jgi:nucleotide-binding universal stress UspA family protein